MIILNVTDLKQYLYCKRIVYFQYVMPVDKKITFKMEYGKSIQDIIEKLETRRNLKRYGLKDGKKSFNVPVISNKVGLSGKLDLLIETKDWLIPVDFKYTKSGVRKNHIIQLAGYALILEDVMQKRVTKGFIYMIPTNRVYVVDLDERIKKGVLEILEAIKEIIKKEIFPGQPTNRAKCMDCEYQNYCRDIW